MAADDFELRLAHAARSLVAEPVSIDVIRAAAAFSARTAARPRKRAHGRLIGIFAVVIAVMLAGLAISPGSPIRRLLVATIASPAPTASVLSPAPASTATPASTSVPTMVAGPSPSGFSTPDASDHSGHLLAFTDVGDRDFVLSIADEDGSNPHVIYSGDFQSWSPSGRYILANTGQREVVLDVAGNPIGYLPSGSASWSPDDHVLVLDRSPNGGTTSSFGLYDVSGSLVRSYQAPDGVTSFDGASWAPDGHAFVTTGCEGCAVDTPAKDNVSDLWVIAADGSGATKISDTPHVFENDPSWSPDGTSISFSTFCRTAHEDCSQADWGTWLIDPDGTNPREILSHIGGTVWSPDGSRLLYSHDESRLGNTWDTWIFVTRADGSDPIQLTDAPAEDLMPAWQSNDRVAYLHREPGTLVTDGTVMTTRADGTQSQPDIVGSFCCSFGWQP